MPQSTSGERAAQVPADELMMFRIEPRPDHGAFLDLTIRDAPGRMILQRYALDQLMVCALRNAFVRELGHVEMPPLRPELAALVAADPADPADDTARHAAAEACSRALYEQIFPADDGSSAA